MSGKVAPNAPYVQQIRLYIVANVLLFTPYYATQYMKEVVNPSHFYGYAGRIGRGRAGVGVLLTRPPNRRSLYTIFTVKTKYEIND